VLIDGYTIHALTFLPKYKHARARVDEVRDIWKNIKCLVIDVSMISAELLAPISIRINQGKAADLSDGEGALFGRENVIFLGNMGQLRPVQASSLFAHSLVKKLNPNVR
jgi:hypothetical protein